MFSDVEKLWFSIRARLLILSICSIIAVYCTVKIQYKVSLGTVLWMLFTEAVMLIILTLLHRHAIKVGESHKRNYRRVENLTTYAWRLALFKQGKFLVFILWILLVIHYGSAFVTYLKQMPDDRSIVTVLGTLSVIFLIVSMPASYFFTLGIWYSYRIIVLDTVPKYRAEQGTEMANIPLAGAEANKRS